MRGAATAFAAAALLLFAAACLTGSGRGPSPLEYAALGRDLLDLVSSGMPPWTRMPLATLPQAVLPDAAWALMPAAELALALTLAAMLAPLSPWRAAALALLLLALGRPFVYAGHGEAAFSLAVTLVAALAAAWGREPNARRALALGAALGLSLLCRSALAPLPPLFAALHWRLAKRPDRARGALLLAVVPYLFLAPWAVMNQAAHGRPLLVEHSAGRLNLLAACAGIADCLEVGPERFELFDAPRQGEPSPWLVCAKEVAARPARWASGFAERLGRVLGWHWWLQALAAGALWAARRRGEARALALLWAAYLFAHASMTVQKRYFAPLLPALAALAVSLPALLRGPGTPSARAPAAAAAALAVGLGAAAWACIVVGRYAAAAARRPPASVQALDEALAGSPGSPRLLRARGRRRLADGDVAGALTDFRAAGDAGPDGELARALAGDPRPLLGRPLEGGPAGFKTALYRARVLLRLGREADATAALRAALERHNSQVVVRGQRTPANEALFARLRTFDNGFAGEALRLAERWPAEERAVLLDRLALLLPASSRVHVLRAELEVERGDLKAAAAAAARAEAAGPGRVERWRLDRLPPLPAVRHLSPAPPPDGSLFDVALERGVRPDAEEPAPVSRLARALAILR